MLKNSDIPIETTASIQRNVLFKIGDCFSKTGIQFDFRNPLQGLSRQRNIRPALPRIILRQRLVYNLGGTAGQLDHSLAQLAHRKLHRISQIHRPHELILVHHSHDSFDEIVNVTKGAGLRAIAVDRYWISPQGLDDEV